MLQRSDRELVDAACHGDIEGFRGLYERHYRMILAIARSQLRDQHLAEDAAQETFAVACQQLSRLKQPDRFPQWLGTICRRTSQRMRRSSQQTVSLVDVPPQNHTSCDQVESDDAKTRLRRAVMRLPCSQREVIYLRYYGDQSYEQIADALGITTQAVHGRLQRARRELTSQLTDHGTSNQRMSD